MGLSFSDNWIDTVLVGALVSTTAAGIYASSNR